VTAPGSGEGPALTGLELVVPGPAWRRCSAVPARAGALETVSCQPSGQADVTYQISGYRNTDELRAAYRRIVHDAGLKPNTDGCTSAHLEGETTWTHSATGALGGHEACFFDRASGDSVIAWTHMRTNVPGEPPQADHRDVLGVARQHSELPNALFTWWGFWHEHIGKLRGT